MPRPDGHSLRVVGHTFRSQQVLRRCIRNALSKPPSSPASDARSPQSRKSLPRVDSPLPVVLLLFVVVVWLGVAWVEGGSSRFFLSQRQPVHGRMHASVLLAELIRVVTLLCPQTHVYSLVSVLSAPSGLSAVCASLSAARADAPVGRSGVRSGRGGGGRGRGGASSWGGVECGSVCVSHVVSHSNDQFAVFLASSGANPCANTGHERASSKATLRDGVSCADRPWFVATSCCWNICAVSWHSA